MARLQTKHHGIVATLKARSKDVAFADSQVAINAAKALDYTIVGGAPGITMMMCPKHVNAKDLPSDADFCYIVQVGK